MRKVSLLVVCLILLGTSNVLGIGSVVKMFDMGTIRPKGTIWDVDQDQRGRIYLPDWTTNTVYVLDKNLEEVHRITHLVDPNTVAVDYDGNVYISAYKHNRIHKFDSNLNEIENWDQHLVRQNRLPAPFAMTVDSNNNLYVADWILKHIIKVSPEGEYILQLRINELVNSGTFMPHGMITDDKVVYVADEGTRSTIQTFSVDGAYLGGWSRPGPIFDPITIDFLAEDLIAVPNFKNGNIHIFDKDGNELTVLEVNGDQPGQFKHAGALVTDPKGFVYVVENKGERIQKMDYRELIASCNRRLKQGLANLSEGELCR